MSSLRSAAVLFVALAVAAGCSAPDDASVSPFPIWGQRLGMSLDSLQQFFIRQDNMPWGGCDAPGRGFKRCWRGLSFVGDLQAVADSQGRVVRIRVDVTDATGGDLMFDNDLGAMERRWFKVKGMRVDNGGVSDANPVGTVTFSTARGRWTVAVSSDGHRCYGAPRACPVRVELTDHRAGVEQVP